MGQSTRRGIFFMSAFFGGFLSGAFFLFSAVPVGADQQNAPVKPSLDLCALRNDFAFFARTEGRQKEPVQAETLSCEDMLALRKVVTLSDEMVQDSRNDSEKLTVQIRKMVAGFPIETMVEAISKYDSEIAGLIVGIGKKESNWGKRTPKLSGDECFNFWGYRGAGDRGLTSDGYGCWLTPEAAVRTIGNRLVELRDLRSSGTPERMIVWKCGNSCATHSPESVRKWIADVDHYYQEIVHRD